MQVFTFTKLMEIYFKRGTKLPTPHY